MRALCKLSDSPHYRRDAFLCGLRAAGYRIEQYIGDPSPDDVLVIWNRGRRDADDAARFESAGAKVLVCENGYLGKDWLGRTWYSISIGHHAGAGIWPDGGPERWDSLGVELAPWRDGRETIILGQRGIGEIGIRSPDAWAETAQARIGGRIRAHPGKFDDSPIEHDLKNAGCVATWASGGALKALAFGVPVFYAMPKWIGATACRPIAEFGGEPLRDDAARLKMFRRLAWAQWQLNEIESGECFEKLSQCD